ncbi:hypothetical protein V501_06862 [Pseudogymnoascus sp. VKM F-4519 (FW-2642)]|nr:hypothetical protein V501_06862 [Pseudogymnoascus sp. VKM F-4519 (FW-2642)]
MREHMLKVAIVGKAASGRGREEAAKDGWPTSWESRKMGRPQGGRTRRWCGYAMAKPRERPQVERSSTCAVRPSTCMGKTCMERSSTRMERPSTCVDRSPNRDQNDRDRRPPNENMTALADDLRHANSNARTPPCEDGVDPFATTAGAANDETTADEDGY